MSLTDLPEEMLLLLADGLRVEGIVALSSSSRSNRKLLLETLLTKTPSILHACLQGHNLFLRSLLRSRAMPPSFLIWPLMAACSKGHHLCAERVLDCFYGSVLTFGIGFEDWFPTMRVGKHVTPVMRDVRLLRRSGYTALMHACEWGHEKCAARLIEAGHDPNESAFHGTGRYDTPLYLACRGGHFPCVRGLVEAGAFLHGRDPYDHTPLMLSCSVGDVLSATTLLEAGASPHAENLRGCTALYDACRGGHVDLISLLLDWGADVNAPSSSVWPRPIFAAIVAEQSEAIERLVEAGADVNSTCPQGTTPLLAACTDGDMACVEALIKGGANVNAASPYGIFPLTRLAVIGNYEPIPALVEAGADLEACSPAMGCTPLLSAVMQGQTKTAKVLLKSGANPLATSTSGYDAITLARGGGCDRTYLEEAIAKARGRKRGRWDGEPSQ